VDKEIDYKKNITIRRKSSCVRRVNFSIKKKANW
jgi:hypothetical protein